MLSGDILIREPLSVALLPPPSLIEFCKIMAAIATLANQQNIDDDDIFLENGLLSYENPNYHMDPQRMERNSHLYEEIISELQQQGTLRPIAGVQNGSQMISNNRKGYGVLDLGPMGVEIKDNPDNRSPKEKKTLLGGDTSPNESKTQKDQEPENGEKTQEIQHIPGTLNSDDLYALPNKRRQSEIGEVPPEEDDDDDVELNSKVTDEDEENVKREDIEAIEDKDKTKDLPPGWEKHEDNGGPYYWHIKTGTIQREPPLWPKNTNHRDSKTPSIPIPRSIQNSSFTQALNNLYGTKDGSMASGNSKSALYDSLTSSVTRSSTSSALDQEEERRRREDVALK